jgi:hypothetical protein
LSADLFENLKSSFQNYLQKPLFYCMKKQKIPMYLPQRQKAY